jgi:hypothetical protein
MQVSKVLLELADREAIRDVILRYARSVDRVDENLMRSVYWEDAVDDHGNFQGKVSDFIAHVIPRLKTLDQTVHLIGNVLIEIHGDAAAVESYFQAYHRHPNASGTPRDIVIAGRYMDRMEKRGGEWRIAYREVIWDWYRQYEDSGDWANPPRGHYQTHHFPNDNSYKVFDTVRTGAFK